jgi:hypothetical protein
MFLREPAIQCTRGFLETVVIVIRQKIKLFYICDSQVETSYTGCLLIICVSWFVSVLNYKHCETKKASLSCSLLYSLSVA